VSYDGLEVHGYILLVKFEVCDLITWYPLTYSKKIHTTHAFTFKEAENGSIKAYTTMTKSSA
jgi:hypothetical protein